MQSYAATLQAPSIKESALEILQHCPVPRVQVFSNYCTNCFQSRTYELFPLQRDAPTLCPDVADPADATYAQAWKRLLDADMVDAYQALSVFDPGHVKNGIKYRRSQFVRPLFTISKPGQPCQNQAKCDPRCLMCWGLLDAETQETVSPQPWPHLKVHQKCCTKCEHPGCQAFLPALQRSLPCRAPSTCPMHAKAPMRPAAPPPDLLLPPVILSPPAKTHLPAVKTIIKRPEPAKTRLDKINAQTKSPSVAGFFASPQRQAVPAPAEPPRRFLRDKKSGEPYAYVVGGTAFHVDTHLPLFQDQPPVRTKFDFTPPTATHLDQHAAQQQDPADAA